MVISHSTRLCN